MALVTRSAVFALRRESTEGELIQPSAGAQFTVLREGFSLTPDVESVASDELTNDIGASKSFTTKQVPSASIPKYFKHSGVEGQEPDWGLMLESALGSVTVNSTEYDVVSATAGSSSAAATITVDTGEGAQFTEGQAILVKDGTNGYSVRNIVSIAGDVLTLNYNLSGAPAAAVALGKAVHYAPTAVGHPTFSAHLYQSGSSSGYHQAIAGARTTSTAITLPVNELSTVDFDFEGVRYFLNPITIDATNKDIDFTDTSGTEVASVEEKSYTTPHDLAAELASKMSASSVDTISVLFDESTGQYVISSDGATLSLLWDTGTNTATSIGDTLGFDTAADDTGSLSYTADNELSYDPGVTPSYDNIDPNVTRGTELLLGSFAKITRRQGSNMSVTISTNKADVDDFSVKTGVSESVTDSRTVEFSATLLLKKHESQEIQDFLDNNTTTLMVNHGQCDTAGNWEPGTMMNIYMPNVSVTANTIDDQDGFQVVNLTATGFVSSTTKDIHINLV
jgi:hypothetical protein